MKRYAALLCCGVLLFWWLLPESPAAVSAAEEPEIPAAAYALLEAETGTVLLESHGSAPAALRAMAKLMTALLAAEQLEQGAWTTDTVLTATDAVTGTKGAVIWLTAGEEMTVGDLLKGLIVGNANDAAVVLAAAAAGDTKQFVMDMNARAFDLGMRDTWFTSPQGDTDTSYTTAADLGRLCCALAKKTALQPISGRGGISCGEKPRNWSTKTPFPAPTKPASASRLVTAKRRAGALPPVPGETACSAWR